MIPWLEGEIAVPPVETALTEPNGLLAAGGDLTPARLIAAYRRGIFPWYSEGDPILWWSPDPRMTINPREIRITRSLGKTVRNRAYEIRFDTAFREVIVTCAAPRSIGGTWITEPMQLAYIRLHELGHAHSVETWVDGTLVGGLYGVALGRMFFGESMFSISRDASKIALVALAQRLARHEYGLIDCQMHTAHLESMGGRLMAREAFCRRVAELVDYASETGTWRQDSFVNVPAKLRSEQGCRVTAE